MKIDFKSMTLYQERVEHNSSPAGGITRYSLEIPIFSNLTRDYLTFERLPYF